MVNEKLTKNIGYNQKVISQMGQGVTAGFARQIAEQQRVISQMGQGVTAGFARQIAEQQRVISQMGQGVTAGLARQIAEQQGAISQMGQGVTAGFARQIAEQQGAISQMGQGVTAGFARQIAEQQRAISQIGQGVTAGLARQIAEQKGVISQFREKIIHYNVQFKESFNIMDELFSTIQEEFENSESAEETFEWQELSITYLSYCMNMIRELQKIYNALDATKAKAIILDIMTVVSFIITLSSSFKDSPAEIHIHNEYENIKIDTESNGKRTDIYIEKKDSPVEGKQDQEQEEEEWLSGGERT